MLRVVLAPSFVEHLVEVLPGWPWHTVGAAEAVGGPQREAGAGAHHRNSRTGSARQT